jgi:MFS family permease
MRQARRGRRRVFRIGIASVAILFFLNGAGWAGLTPRLPELIEQAGLDEAGLGRALLGQGLGLACMMLWLVPKRSFPRRIIARVGQAPVAAIAAVAYFAAIAACGLAQTEVALFGAFLAVGLANGPLDFAQNSLALALEKLRKTVLLPRLEILFYSGGVVGAAIGTWCIPRVALATQLTVTAVGASVLAVLAWLGLRRLVRELGSSEEVAASQEESTTPSRVTRLRAARRSRRNIGWLAVVGFAAFWAEGSVIDWSALFYERELAAPPGMIGLGTTAFNGALLIGLLAGTRVSRRFGATTVIGIGGGVFTIGMIVALQSSSIVVVTAGLAAAGLGLANAHPLALSVAGRFGSGENVSATINTAAYIGLVFEKPLIGFLAAATSLPLALATCIPVGLLLIVAVARVREVPAG